MADRVLPGDRPLPGDLAGTVVTVGTFDGVHRGHQDLLRRVAARGRERGLPSLVVTFEPHPLAIVNPEAAPLLLTVGAEKLDAILAAGIDHVAVVPFTRELAERSAPEFVHEVLCERFRMRELWIGYDHGLGRRREGDAATLRALGEREGYPVEVVEAVTGPDGVPLSSSAIRRALADGRLDDAERALGRRYGFRGPVVTGHRRGRLLGYPTINIAFPPATKLLPSDGVYAVVVDGAMGRFGGMMNLGARPTFDDPTRALEVHMFGADGDWYGAEVRVEFVARLRDVVRFPSVDALVAQLGRDAEAARGALTEVQKGLTLNGST